MEDFNGDLMLEKICLGNRDAMNFLLIVTQFLHFWDDLVDKDQTLPDSETNARMWSVLVDLPRNQFYLTNFVALNSILMTAIVNWEIATHMERHPQGDDMEIAFIIRSSYVDLLTMTALLLGGREHAYNTMLPMRRYVHNEGLEGFKKALIVERAKREGK